ncbi:PDDEXK nuclease domain-containing protein [Flavobacterium sp. IMCC34518]|uniref:PDDEXK nuclease domain-containing protein n=1 Tax=Flavobacterium sp. IMCC34518 TaxID=3003623 RepID=UPI0022ABE8C1|nr:PDDEXK nuclease domain-containing protein [Flavobacterium sp. IMCC34518]
MKNELKNTEDIILSDIRLIIYQTKEVVSKIITSNVASMYWKIGNRINSEMLDNQRAEYGKQIVATLSRQLTIEYGRSYEEKNLRRMIQFANQFSDIENVATLWRQLSWSHFKILIPIKDELERDFYTQMCRIENWSVDTLRKKINSLLFQRTAISKKPEELAKLEIQQLKSEDILTPDLVFRDPYLLDFLGLKDVYQEKDLEKAILREIEQFILELGNGFAFLERQKRMQIDNEDYYLDLLFYHRKLKRLVAIELKIGKFEASYKGQMELYLRWLEKHEKQEDEEAPIGLILCAEGNKEQIELLQLDATNIKVGEFITQFIPNELLKQKLHKAIQFSKSKIDRK